MELAGLICGIISLIISITLLVLFVKEHRK